MRLVLAAKVATEVLVAMAIAALVVILETTARAVTAIVPLAVISATVLAAKEATTARVATEMEALAVSLPATLRKTPTDF